ncbi:t-complex protein 1 subunit delta [Trichonephila clavata]|uniref:T-complex protein 1 subunit delta n=1 Tax=Trichonephila clavata TaxID=2740835 RepID=A0A8X6G8X3_TRICU|nr:t-complex protein 1 subunit delta [Trichonephila clavata]
MVRLAEVLRSILNDWGIDVQNIMSITTDNGRNILKSIEELNLENAHISCFAHNINIGDNHSLDIPVLKRAIARLKKLQNAFAMSWKMKRSPQSPRVTTNGGKNTSLCLSNSMVEHFKISETISGKSAANLQNPFRILK